MSMSLVARGFSPRFAGAYGQNSAVQTANRSAVNDDRRPDSDGDDVRRTRNSEDGPSRRNPLVAALMQALQGLVPGANSAGAATSTSGTPGSAVASTNPAAAGTTAAAAGTPALTTDTASTTATTTPATPSTPADTSSSTGSSKDVKDAAYAFAHELFSALRGAGKDNDSDSDGRHQTSGHHGRHAGHSAGGGGYGDLVQGLEALAHTLDALAAAGPAAAGTVTTPTAAPGSAGAPTPASGAAVSTPGAAVAGTTPGTATGSPAITAPTAVTSTSNDGSASLSLSITVQITLPGGFGQPEAGAGKSTGSPLLAAFARLLDKLDPAAGSGAGAGTTANPATPGANTDSPSAKLKSFLLGLAAALKGDSSASRQSIPGSTVGSLVDVSA